MTLLRVMYSEYMGTEMLVSTPIMASTATNSTKLRPRCRAVDLRGIDFRGNDLGVIVMAKGAFGLSGGRVSG